MTPKQKFWLGNLLLIIFFPLSPLFIYGFVHFPDLLFRLVHLPKLIGILLWCVMAWYGVWLAAEWNHQNEWRELELTARRNLEITARREREEAALKEPSA